MIVAVLADPGALETDVNVSTGLAHLLSSASFFSVFGFWCLLRMCMAEPWTFATDTKDQNPEAE